MEMSRNGWGGPRTPLRVRADVVPSAGARRAAELDRRRRGVPPQAAGARLPL